MKQLEAQGADFRDEVDKSLPCPELSSGIQLRGYQRRALDAWAEADHRDVVILPTGSGKRVLALKGIEEMGLVILIVVPTLVLVDQWRRELESALSVEVSVLGDGRREIRALMVATYDSASLRAPQIGNLFSKRARGQEDGSHRGRGAGDVRRGSPRPGQSPTNRGK